jgi:hypothetical protein
MRKPKKYPGFMFYHGDWMKDPALSICSAAARGVWMDVICLMFESPKRGFLITENGIPWTLEQIAVCTRGDWQENLACLKELIRNGVMKQATKGHRFRGKIGAYFSARIARDEGQREAWRSQKRRQFVEKKESRSGSFSSSSSSSLSSSLSTTTSKAFTNPKSPQEAAAVAITPEESAAAFQAIGFERPFGHKEFQSLWIARFKTLKNSDWLSDVMEKAILEAQSLHIGVPPQFFEAKHVLEKIDLASARKLPL